MKVVMMVVVLADTLEMIIIDMIKICFNFNFKDIFYRKKVVWGYINS
jgi:hypothetical protein